MAAAFGARATYFFFLSSHSLLTRRKGPGTLSLLADEAWGRARCLAGERSETMPVGDPCVEWRVEDRDAPAGRWGRAPPPVPAASLCSPPAPTAFVNRGECPAKFLEPRLRRKPRSFLPLLPPPHPRVSIICQSTRVQVNMAAPRWARACL